MALGTAAGPQQLIGADVWSVPVQQLAGRYGGERDQAAVGDRPSREETLAASIRGVSTQGRPAEGLGWSAPANGDGRRWFLDKQEACGTETEETPVEGDAGVPERAIGRAGGSALSPSTVRDGLRFLARMCRDTVSPLSVSRASLPWQMPKPGPRSLDSAV
jgi:hypothetical protein